MSNSNRLSQLSQFLSEEPNDVFINYALGMEYISSGDTDKAAQFFEKTIELNPDYIAAYYQYGKLLEAGNIQKAIQLYQNGIAIAQKLNKHHELKELKEALAMLTYEDD